MYKRRLAAFLIIAALTLACALPAAAQTAEYADQEAFVPDIMFEVEVDTGSFVEANYPFSHCGEWG